MFKTFIFSKNNHEEPTELGISTDKIAVVYNKQNLVTRTYNKKLLIKIFKTSVLTSCVLSMFLSMSQTALAGYQPPKDQKPPTGHSDSSGIRIGYKTKPNSERGAATPIKNTNSFASFVTEQIPVAKELKLHECDISGNNNHSHPTDIHPKTGIQDIAYNEVLLSPSQKAIDKFLDSLLISFVKLEKLDITSIIATLVYINNRW